MQRALFRRMVFSVRTFAGAMLALWIAFRLDLDRPYWALMTAYIVAQPLAGMVRSKSVYRIVGTVVGASVAVGAVPALVNAPLLLSLFLAGWISLCLYLALLDSTPRSYAFMLAGYTAALIGFPSVDNPAVIFETAVSRVEEITIGILCTTVLSELVFPERVGPLLARRLEAWFAEIAFWAEQVLAGASGRPDRVRLASSLAELETLRVHAGFESPGAESIHDVQAAFSGVQRRMQMLIPIIDGIENRVRALNSADRATLRPVLQETAAWIGSPERAEAKLLARLASSRNIGPVIDWNTAMRVGLLDLMRELVELWAECRDLRRSIGAGSGARSEQVVLEHHRDHRKAALSAIAAFIGIGLCVVVWIATDWPDGFIAAEMGAVLCCIFAAQDDPAPAIASFLHWANAAAVIAAVYLFAILPAIDGFPLLVAALAPTYLLLGFGLATPGWLPIAMPLIINSLAPLALGEVYSASFAGFLNSVIAQAVGIGLALGTTKALRSMGSEQALRRMVRANRRELALLAAGQRAPDRAMLEGRVLDRLGFPGSRLEAETAARALAGLRAGLNVIRLRQKAGELPGPASRAVRAVLARIAREFRTDPDALPSDMLRARMDLAFRRTADAAEDVPLALAGLRRALFPHSPPPEGPSSPVGEDRMLAA